MRTIFVKIWTAFVAALTGACIGLVVAIVLLMSGFSIDVGLSGIAICAALGAVAGFVLGKANSQK